MDLPEVLWGERKYPDVADRRQIVEGGAAENHGAVVGDELGGAEIPDDVERRRGAHRGHVICEEHDAHRGGLVAAYRSALCVGARPPLQLRIRTVLLLGGMHIEGRLWGLGQHEDVARSSDEKAQAKYAYGQGQVHRTLG